MVRLSPPERIGEFFGLYGLVGKGSQVIGQILYGATIALFLVEGENGAYQLAVLTLLGTMFVGLWLLRGVSDRWAGSGVRVPEAARGPSAGRRTPSVGVAARVAPPPLPGRRDHLVERRPPRLPAEHRLRPLRGRDEDRRIAGPPRPDRVGDRPRRRRPPPPRAPRGR